MIELKIEKELYDLPTLQKYMFHNKEMSVSETVKIAESLYEKGIISYPRVLSREIQHDINDKSKELFLSILLNSTLPRKDSIKKFFNSEKNEYEEVKNCHIFELSFVDGEVNIPYSAIVPTTKVFDSNELSEKELFVYESIVNAFIVGFEKRI